MALAAFDTLEFVDELEKSGVPEKQARAISWAVRKSHESLEVATKADLDKLGTELRHEIGDLRKDMDAKFAGMEQRFDAKLEKMAAGLRQEMSDMKFVLIKWVVGLGIAQTGLWFTLKLLPIGS